MGKLLEGGDSQLQDYSCLLIGLIQFFPYPTLYLIGSTKSLEALSSLHMCQRPFLCDQMSERSDIGQAQFILAHSLRGDSPSQQRQHTGRSSGGCCSSRICSQETAHEQEVGLGCKTSRPLSCDLLPPWRLYLLAVLKPSQQRHPLGTKCSNTGACGGRFHIQTPSFPSQ